MIGRSSTAIEIAAAVRSGAVSAVDVTQAALSRIGTDDPQLGAFTAVTADRALAEAAKVDAVVTGGGSNPWVLVHYDPDPRHTVAEVRDR